MVDSRLVQANDRLKDSKTPVRIKLRGSALFLVATVPSKDGTGNKQQEIRTGLKDTTLNIKDAESLAHDLAKDLRNNTFSWEKWRNKKKDSGNSSHDLIESFRASLFAQGNSPETVKHFYDRYLRYLDGDLIISEQQLKSALNRIEINSYSRWRACQVFERLAKFAGLECNLSNLKGKFRPGLTPKYIPAESEIYTEYEKIKTKHWAWVYGMLACYGLRPHEAFFCEFHNAEGKLFIKEGKTGSRYVFPIFPKFLADFALLNGQSPKIEYAVYQKYGKRVNNTFLHYGISFSPYCLRHACAIQLSVVLNFPIKVAAAMLGHSPEVHMATYQKWLTEEMTETIYKQKMQQ